MPFLDWFRKRSRRPAEFEGAAIEFEQGIREIAFVHYRGAEGTFTFDAEWLGWGKGQARHLLVELPAEISSVSAQPMAYRILGGLRKLRIRCVIKQWEAPIPIPADECEQGLVEYSAWMRSMGREVTIDRAAKTIAVPGPGLGAGIFATMNRDDFFRRTRDATFCLKGYRSSLRLLVKSEDLKNVD